MIIDLRCSRRRWAFVLPGVLGCLSACATLPSDEATAFHKLAAANKGGFTSLAEADREAAAQNAIRRVARDEGDLDLQSCGAKDANDCTVTFKQDGAIVDLGVPSVNTRRLIGAISEYGERMADLAEAKDVDALAAKAQAAGSAVQGLFAAVPGGQVIGAVINAGELAYRARLVEKRRHLLLVNARAADPAIILAAKTLTDLAERSRKNITLATAQAVKDAASDLLANKEEISKLKARRERLIELAERGSRWAETTLDTVEERLHALQVRQEGQAEQVIGTARSLNAAKKLDVDFSDLAKAHADLIAKLEKPDLSVETALANINGFLGVLDQLTAVGKPEK